MPRFLASHAIEMVGVSPGAVAKVASAFGVSLVRSSSGLRGMVISVCHAMM